jgi:hypothetical protein
VVLAELVRWAVQRMIKEEESNCLVGLLISQCGEEDQEQATDQQQAVVAESRPEEKEEKAC